MASNNPVPLGVPKKVTICRKWLTAENAARWYELHAADYDGQVILCREEHSNRARLDYFPQNLAQARAFMRVHGGRLVELTPDVWWHPERPDARPLLFGRRLAIVVSQPQRDYWREKLPRREILIISEGMAFGTGQHATTAMCLRRLDALAPQLLKNEQPAMCIDIGTGSGLLAIAAARLGFRPVYAMDNDPVAVRVARANARANAVRINWSVGDVANYAAPAPASLVFANLFSGLLIASARIISQSVARDGVLVLSGIRHDQESEVLQAYKKFTLRHRSALRGWVCLELHRTLGGKKNREK